MAMDMITQTAQMASQAPSQGLSLKAKPATYADALKAGKNFESMFLSQMLKPMFDTIKTDGWFGGGQGEEMFRGLLVDNYAKSVANHGNGLGIAPVVAKSLLAAQEVHA